MSGEEWSFVPLLHTIGSRIARRMLYAAYAPGHATLPALGMGEIPRQLAHRLDPQAVRLNTRVAEVRGNTVRLESGETISGRSVVLATDAFAEARLMPALDAARKD